MKKKQKIYCLLLLNNIFYIFKNFVLITDKNEVAIILNNLNYIDENRYPEFLIFYPNY